MRIPVGWLTDKVGGRLMFTIVLLAATGPAVLLGYAES
jgi:nitrate/nitrite transporter NarK